MGYRSLSPRIVAPIIPLVIALALAAPARADDQAYLNDIGSHGVPTFNPPHILGLGYKICAQIHEGMSPTDAANQFGVLDRIYSPAIVDAAQHDLCPNTLPAPGPAAAPPPPR